MRIASARRWLSTAAAATFLATTAAAHAEGPGTPESPPQDPGPAAQAAQPGQQTPAYRPYEAARREARHWYGWQTMIVDGGWLLGGSVLATRNVDVGAGIIIGGYLLGPPIVHWAHGQVGRGFADLGIRAGAPILLGLLGYAAVPKGSQGGLIDCDCMGGVYGGALGMIAAIAIDATFLAYEPVHDQIAMRRPPHRNALLPVTLTPLLGPRPEGGAVIGVSGTLY